MKGDYQDDAVFIASLDGIKLSQEQIERIDNGIKNVVMAELANIDNGGDFIINRKLSLNPKFKDLGRTVGIWAEDLHRHRTRMGF